ncbi:WD repeat-containing protein 41 [Lamellibrachia satsuma]|nr:WD repeat-containing protein 41 [Lamellibrachia satsuma]
MMSAEMMRNDQPLNPYTQIQILSQHTGVVRRLLKISKYRCVSVSDDCQAIVWNIQSGRKWRTLVCHTRPITCMCLLDGSTDGRQILLTGASDKRICIWDTETGTCLKCMEDLGSVSRSFVSLEDGSLFCSGGEKLCLWTQDGELLHSRERDAEEDVQQLLAVRNDVIVAGADRDLIVYSVLTRGTSKHLSLLQKLPQHREAVRSLVKVNELLFASGSLDGTIVLWSVETFVPLQSFNCVEDYQGDDRLYRYSIQHMMAVEGSYIVSTVGSGFCVYEVESGTLLVEKVSAHYSKILHVEFVFSGHLLATCSEDGSIRLWGSSKALQRFVEEEDEGEGNRERERSLLENFLGLSIKDMESSTNTQCLPIEPQLLGESIGHSGAVQMCLDFGVEGVLSCGADGLVILWRDGIHESMRRTLAVTQLLYGVDRSDHS